MDRTALKGGDCSEWPWGALRLVIVAELNVVRVAVVKPKANAPLIIDRDRMLPCTIAFEGVKPAAGRNAQVVHLRRDMHRLELSQGAARDVGRHSPCFSRTEELFGLTVGEGLDHTEL